MHFPFCPTNVHPFTQPFALCCCCGPSQQPIKLLTVTEPFQSVNPAEICHHADVKGRKTTSGFPVRTHRVIVDHLLQALSKLCETGLWEEKRKNVTPWQQKRIAKKHCVVLKQGHKTKKSTINANFNCTMHESNSSVRGVWHRHSSAVWGHYNTLGKDSWG